MAVFPCLTERQRVKPGYQTSPEQPMARDLLPCSHDLRVRADADQTVGTSPQTAHPLPFTMSYFYTVSAEVRCALRARESSSRTP
jgi:hypothetical protein